MSGRYAAGVTSSARCDPGPQTQVGLINPACGSAALAGGTPGGCPFQSLGAAREVRDAELSRAVPELVREHREPINKYQTGAK